MQFVAFLVCIDSSEFIHARWIERMIGFKTYSRQYAFDSEICIYKKDVFYCCKSYQKKVIIIFVEKFAGIFNILSIK